VLFQREPLVALQSLERTSAILRRLLALSLLLFLGIASAADASVGETIILRCTHKQSLGGFSQQAYNEALKELNATTEEYTDCATQIRQAQLAAAGGGGGSGGGASVVPIVPTPSEQKAITRAAHAGSTPVRVGSEVINPGVVHANIASAISSLPTPLLATVAFLLACLLLVAGGALRSHLRARRPG
jgi:hypothetical protein